MVDIGASCGTDLRLVGSEFHKRRQELRKPRSEIVRLEVKGRKRWRWSEDIVLLPVGLMSFHR